MHTLRGRQARFQHSLTEALQRLGSDDETERLEALARISTARADELERPEELAHRLTELLADPSARVVHAALEAVGSLAHREVITFAEGTETAVEALATHDAPAVRAEVAVALALVAETNRGRRLTVLRSLLEDDHPRVRREAAAALGDLSDPRARPVLLSCLEQDPDAETRFEAAFALASLKSNEGSELLIEALRSSARRADACEALARLGETKALEPLERMATAFLVPWPERLIAATAMVRIGSPRGAELLIERTTSWNRAERQLAIALIGMHRIAAGLDLLREIAQSERDRLRPSAVAALGDYGDPADLPLIESIQAQAPADSALAEEAEAALKKLKGTET